MSRAGNNLVTKIVVLAIVAVLLAAALIVVWFVVLPALEEENKPSEPIYVAPGEGLYLNTMITVYPEINKQDITYLEIKNPSGSYAFHMYYDREMGMENEEMRFVGHEAIDYNKSMYSVLIAYIYLPVSYQSNTVENAPMRDVSEEKMREYGVTEDTCQASYTVGYKTDSGETKYHTVYIGHATFSSETTYYVALKGRNSVYRFHQEGVEDCIMASMEEYLSPMIFGKYSSSTEAMVNIERFKIGLTNPDKLGTEDYVRSLIEIVRTGQNADGTINMYDLYYESLGTGAIVKTGASTDQISIAFQALYTYFAGESVIAVDPSAEMLKEYGLSVSDPCYYITAQFSKDEKDTYSIQISQEKDGYFYTLATTYGEGNHMLVKVPKSTLTFLGSDDKTIFSWAGKDISSLFYAYLLAMPDDGEPGIASVDIRIQKKNDLTGEITYDIKDGFDIVPNGNGGVIATQKTNGKEYVSELNAQGTHENQFTDFYRLLVYFPTPASFNNLTQAQIDALKADDGALIFELVVRDNAGGLEKYSYYQIGTSLDVMVEVTKGQVTNGHEVWELPQVNFNVKLSEIDILRINFQKLLAGEDVRPEDYIY